MVAPDAALAAAHRLTAVGLPRYSRSMNVKDEVKTGPDVEERVIRLTREEAALHDAEAAKVGVDWSEWIREAAKLAIARGSTR